MKLDLPIYEMYIDDENDGLYTMGLVDEPAIERNWIMMDQQKPITLSADDMKRIIFGPALIPEQPIYRRDASGEYYIVFSRETIDEMVEKWSKSGLMNEVDIMHDHDLYTDQCTLVELFQKDSARGINPTPYSDLPDGTLFLSYKVQEPLWGMIKSGELNLNGFSIEAFMSFKRKDDTDQLIDEILSEAEKSKKKVEQSSNIVFYTGGELQELMDANKVYEIKYDGKTITAQIYALTDGGDGIEVMTADKAAGKNTWKNIKIADIDSITATNDPYLPWETDTKSFNDFINSNNTVTRTVIAPPATIDEMIKQRTLVMINYDDKKDNDNPPEGSSHTSARQCAIIARGLTHKGNSCIRVFQFFGDSRSIAEGYAEGPLGDYRLMLEKRITQLRPMTFAEPWQESDLDLSKLNMTGDDGMAVLYTHYSDFI